MSGTITITSGATLRSKSGIESKRDSVSQERIHIRSVSKPERQLSDLITKVAFSTFAAIQASLAGLFLAAALLGIATSFAELSRLLERDAISQVAEKAICEFNQNRDLTRLPPP